MQTFEFLEIICLVGWLVCIVWKYLSKRSMSSLLAQLIFLSMQLFLQITRLFEAFLLRTGCKGILFYIAFLLVNILLNGYQMEERAKKFR